MIFAIGLYVFLLDEIYLKLSRSQYFTVLSFDPVASFKSHGLYLRQVMGPSWRLKVWKHFCLAMSQSFTRESSPPEAIHWQSGLSCIQFTAPVCPLKVATHFLLRISQSLIFWSCEPLRSKSL